MSRANRGPNRAPSYAELKASATDLHERTVEVINTTLLGLLNTRPVPNHAYPHMMNQHRQVVGLPSVRGSSDLLLDTQSFNLPSIQGLDAAEIESCEIRWGVGDKSVKGFQATYDRVAQRIDIYRGYEGTIGADGDVHVERSITADNDPVGLAELMRAANEQLDNVVQLDTAFDENASEY